MGALKVQEPEIVQNEDLQFYDQLVQEVESRIDGLKQWIVSAHQNLQDRSKWRENIQSAENSFVRFFVGIENDVGWL